MRSIRYSPGHCLSSLDDLVQFCFGLTAGCFLVGAVLAVAGCFLPIGPRGVGLFAVGCFYLVHGMIALASQWWNRPGVPVERPQRDVRSHWVANDWARQWEGGIAG
jgi:hypothetical protein